MPIERYWILTARKLNGEATPGELEELEALSAEHPEITPTVNALERVWHQEVPIVSADEQQRLLALLEQRVPEIAPVPVVVPVQRRHSRFAWAAGFLLLAAIGSGLLFYTHQPHVAVHEVVANRGTRSQVRLPDGSVVWLNAGSKLVYDDDYGTHDRLLQLEGEAYFDVAQQANVPFEVKVKGATVKVLGTSFNLRAYTDEAMVETALISGSVQLQFEEDAKPRQALLKPGQKLILTRQPGNGFIASWQSLRSNKKEDVKEIAWKDNTLSFNKESFSSLATRLERWYNITVIFEQPRLKQLEFTGSIKGEKIQEVMDVLSRTSGQFNYRYDQTNSVLKISSK
ncbi:MAG: FecR domain-containing protein [Chitinophaga sp.]|uniref:FecR family protein n=1 Tax=Chitinophaga sp. TaxID=1869181 RepID=UPI001B2664AF|nr:FecR domain-containing protein [Chitinophaga sp.]MBO9727482.1 FecR domain-containing protein [Chitinophaga sp.]